GKVRRLAEELPAGDECLKNNVAQVRALVEHAPQRLARDLEHLAAAPGNGADDGFSAGQVRDLAGELALAMDRDPLRLIAGIIDDFDLARLHDEELHVVLA